MSELSNEALTQVLERIDTHNREAHEEIMKNQNENNGRISELEQWKSMMLGGLLVLSFLFGGGAFLSIILFLIQ